MKPLKEFVQEAKELHNNSALIMWWNILDKGGYPSVEVPWPVNETEMKSWMNANIKHSWEYHGRTIWFDDEKEAMFFKLKWVC